MPKALEPACPVTQIGTAKDVKCCLEPACPVTQIGTAKDAKGFGACLHSDSNRNS